MEAAPAVAARSSSSASWAPARRPAARAAAAALGVRGGRRRPRARAAPRQLDRGLLRRARRARVPRGRGGGRRRAARARRRRRCSRSAAARSPPSACASCSRATPSCCSTSTPTTAWQRAGGKRRPLARDRERFAALHAERAPLYEALADAVLPDAAPRRGAPRACPRCARSRAPAGHAAAVGGARVGRLPGATSATGCSAAASGRSPGRRVPRHRRDGRPRCYGDARSATSRPTLRDRRRARRPRRSRSAERVLRGLAAAGMDHDDHVVALGGGVVGDLAGFCAAIYQRGVRGRAGADDARRAGRLRLRRQDRRRPAGGQELRRRLPPAARPCSPTRATLATLPAGGARRRLGRGGQDRADRRRRRCGSACARGDADRRPRPRARVRAHEARGRGRRTSATPAAARSSTSATRSGTRSRPRPATRATATARRSASACWPR